jgi:transposase
MIVIGTDTHKRTHTAAVVVAGTGELSGELTASALARGFAEMLRWAEGLDSERIWAIEDCRHVSGGLERFLVGRGERVVRVAPKLMGVSRRAVRSAGKSDSIDALAIARAALAEGPERLPAATVDEEAHDIKLLLDHHDDLVAQRSDDQRRLRWHLHDLWPELELPAGCLDRERWLQKISRRLGRAEQSMHPGAKAYLARKQAEGRTRMDALRCLKRYLVRRVFVLLSRPMPTLVSTAHTAVGLT